MGVFGTVFKVFAQAATTMIKQSMIEHSIQEILQKDSRESGRVTAQQAFYNIVTKDADGVDTLIQEWWDLIVDQYDLKQMAVEVLGIEGIPWENGIYDKDHDGIDYEEEVENLESDMVEKVAQQWLNGEKYIPDEVLEWAFYEVSDHNR